MDSRTPEEPKPDADQNLAIQLLRLVAPPAVATDYEDRLRAGGMGYGDFKLLALFGAWLGWQSLLLIVLLSSLVGAILGGVMIVFLKQDRSVPSPFGPYLGMAGWVAMLWGSELTAMYFRLAGIH